MKVDKALADIQLIGTKIEKLDLQNDFIAFYEGETTKKYLDTSYRILESSYDEKNQMYIGTLALFVNMEIVEEEIDKHIKLDIEIHGGFRAVSKEELLEEKFNELLRINGAAALYSIVRSVVMSVTSQAYVGEAIVLPMVNVFRLQNEKK